jgi:carboxypeptidase Taq
MKPEMSYEAYRSKLSKIADLGFAGAVLSWDQQVFMPKLGAKARGRQMATLSTLGHELFTGADFGGLLDSLVNDPALTEAQRINVKLTRKDFERKKKLPDAFVEKMALITAEAFGAWVEARRQKDFSLFRPLLEQIVALKREETRLLGFNAHPYEALLEDYEPGLTVAKIDEVFGRVREELFPLIQKILSRPRPDHSFLAKHYPKGKQWAFSEKMIRQMGYDFDSGRADDAPHPFCTTFGPGDVRITLRSDEHELAMMLFAAIHEAGHGLYELGLPLEEHYGMPLGSALSLAFHESQSRFWENNIARSFSYWKANYRTLQAEFPENLGSVSLESFYRGINRIEPSFVRVEADELTYHAHIYIRYLIEKALIEGSIEVADVPRVWNDRYEEFLGIRPSHDSEGCLQDIHWAYGSFGYFPTYSFGSFYAAQLAAAMKRQIPGYDDLTSSGNFAPLLQWLRSQVHSKGREFTSEELLIRCTGKGLDVGDFMDYARTKYGSIYGL